MIKIDGAFGEGGGQILRTSLALSVITGQTIEIHNIRAKRPKPGLLRQHLTCVQAATAISDAQVQGAQLGSTHMVFEPQGVRAGDYTFNIGTAGSCTLVLQTIWPALMLADAPSRVHLTGGTHNPMAPPFQFLQRSYAPLLAKLGAHSTLTLKRMGFAPAGGGEIEAHIAPITAGIAPINLMERGARVDAYAEAFAPALPRAIAHRELQQLERLLGWTYEANQLRMGECRQNEGPGNALLISLEHEHVTTVFSRLGEKNVSAEKVASNLAKTMRTYFASEQAALDEYLTDQWALPLALAVHHSQRTAQFTCTTISLHARTNFRVIEQFLPVQFNEQHLGSYWLVTCATTT
ncbi:RNA 3'-terminal phosphate cyclase [Lampropedia puyangensis]|uniref:RNA 3'-terminal phosphate cyclase n=1 Tax=Lampropedia puyangensis TaxID=1330072 RepID=A0A4S8EN22_9BURK|nr:RNA 3'-terminal phosphate cyclase [Lampropedia puyangensis]THT96062.1 RNA 3'-terminal phosphate cyclase [Lampropedia puyangensis]